MNTIAPPLPECLQKRGFRIEPATEAQPLRLCWRRGRAYQAMLDLLLLASLAGLAWAGWRWHVLRAAADTSVAHAPGLAVLGALAVVAGLGYASFRRLELALGPGRFERQVCCGMWRRTRLLLADEPCVVQYRDDGNNQGHHCVLALAEPAWWQWRGPARVLLWHHRDAAAAAALAEWLNQARGVASESPAAQGAGTSAGGNGATGSGAGAG